MTLARAFALLLALALASAAFVVTVHSVERSEVERAPILDQLCAEARARHPERGCW